MKYFEGFYIKCTGFTGSAAFIFGKQMGRRDKTAFVQVITEQDSFFKEYDLNSYFFKQRPFEVSAGNCRADSNGLFLNIESEGLCVKGELFFGRFSPIRYDAMGFLKYVPFLECRHTVVSMAHALSGKISINGREYDFNGGSGYIEGDRGKSFPKKYLWTSCSVIEASGATVSIFSSCATIPYMGISFKGTVSVILFEGREYRFATYLGATVKEFTEKKLTVKQRSRLLEIEVLDDGKSFELLAPAKGEMSRVITESLKRTVRYKLTAGAGKKKKVFFDVISTRAAFEFSNTF